MPKVNVYNIKGDIVGELDLNEAVFGVEINKEVLSIAVHNLLSNRRQGTQSTKTKSEVRGGGRKPWRQKGTGRARQGSIRSAQWIKGGIVLGPKPRSYRYSLPKKVKRLAMKSAFSSKLAEEQILVLESLNLENIKTKEMVNILGNLKVEGSAVIVLPEKNDIVQKSARNIPGIKTLLTNTLNVYDLLKYDKCIITKDAVLKVEEVYA